jgi:hypothetical protein
MTVEEMLARESIRQTMAGYTMAGDRLKIDAFVAVFTEDGILETDGVPQADAFRYEGREDIRGWMTRWQEPAGGAPVHQSRFIRHHLSTSQIEFTGAGAARSRTYWTAYTDIGPDHCGYYLDTFRKVGEQWLIAHRIIRLDWRSERGLYSNAVARTAAADQGG